MDIQNTAHFTMQSKGGAGKSVCSVLLGQYLLEKNKDLILIDTDPSNKTLGSYQALDVQKIEVLNKNDIVDQSSFDGFINDFLNGNAPIIVDTGSGDFLPINGYMKQNEIPALFSEVGKQLVIHCPIVFNQAKADTVRCLMNITSNHPDTPIVVWQNEFFGEDDGDFSNSALFKKTPNIIGTIKIRKMNTDTEERDFGNMLNDSLTFEQVAKSKDQARYGFMQKTRINRIKKEVWEQLDELFDVMAGNDTEVVEA